MKKITFYMRLQDGDEVIPAGAIDWTRFERNPVILAGHQWHEPPIGMLTSVDREALTGIPVFHGLSTDSALARELNLQGWSGILIGYPGGEAQRDADGKITKFTIYEISLLL